jgi:hypothetical protein
VLCGEALFFASFAGLSLRILRLKAFTDARSCGLEHFSRIEMAPKYRPVVILITAGRDRANDATGPNDTGWAWSQH